MLEAKQLFKNVGTTPILRGVDLTLKEGTITGIFSLEKIETRALLSVLSGHEKPLSGSVILDGGVLEHRPRGFAGDGVQMVPGTSRLFSKLTLLKNLVLGMGRTSIRGGKTKIASLVGPILEEFGFHHSFETIVGEMTIPDQQLVSLVMFLVQEAPVLLMRDLLNNLTLDQYGLFVKKIRALAASGRTLAIVPESPGQLFDFCDEIVLLRNGKSIFSSPVGEVDVEEVYNILNNSEHTIKQSLENKFHQFQTSILDPQVLYEKGLTVLGNFCGHFQAFLLSDDGRGQVQITLGKYWKGPAPERKEWGLVWNAAVSSREAWGTLALAECHYSWNLIQSRDVGAAFLVLADDDEREFPFQVVVDGLTAARRHLAGRLATEALARQRELDAIRLGKEMDIARNIQASILPRKFQLPGYVCGIHLETATEVGGDSYDLLETSLGNFISIGDVSGHGLPSGIMALIEMAALHGVIQTHLKFSQPAVPSVMYDLVNKVLCEINRDRIGSDKFMTKILLVENQGHFFHGGTHEVGLLYTRKNQQVRELDKMVDKTGFLGLSEHVDSQHSLGQFRMDQGDVLFLYTDGLIEAKNAAGEQYGIERVKALLMREPEREPRQILDEVKKDLLEFSKDGDGRKHDGRLADDLTMILLRRDLLAATAGP